MFTVPASASSATSSAVNWKEWSLPAWPTGSPITAQSFGLKPIPIASGHHHEFRTVLLQPASVTPSAIQMSSSFSSRPGLAPTMSSESELFGDQYEYSGETPKSLSELVEGAEGSLGPTSKSCVDSTTGFTPRSRRASRAPSAPPSIIPSWKASPNSVVDGSSVSTAPETVPIDPSVARAPAE
jgi:hypothetical protein